MHGQYWMWLQYLKFLPQDTIDSMDIIILSMDIFWSFVVIFGVCEFGDRLSGTFNEINYVYDELSWYLLPCKIQQTLIILMVFAQKPVQLHVFGTWFGSISCDRITLKSVSKTFMFHLKWNFTSNVSCHPCLGMRQRIFVLYGASAFRQLKSTQTCQNQLEGNWNGWVLYILTLFAFKKCCTENYERVSAFGRMIETIFAPNATGHFC